MKFKITKQELEEIVKEYYKSEKGVDVNYVNFELKNDKFLTSREIGKVVAMIHVSSLHLLLLGNNAI